MSFNSDGFWDPDEQLRMLDLAQSGFAANDLVMLVDRSGTTVVGESTRQFADGKSRLNICGYSWGLAMRGAAGSTGARTFQPLYVVRRIDSATASLASLVHARTGGLTVCISAFRAGGDETATDTQPMFEVQLQDAQITGQFLTTGGPLSTMSEILAVNYREITLRSSPQTSTGARGAVRECTMTPTPS
ncbi:type VI secretion system tube protein Hcp [Variovorax sp. RT4R15]|uniref:type VI secretion system tube protein Hcp n=1 Tax=Variovorax sp. RT4R15 TaxID=3443737 RepID=UPI003F44FEA5